MVRSPVAQARLILRGIDDFSNAVRTKKTDNGEVETRGHRSSSESKVIVVAIKFFFSFCRSVKKKTRKKNRENVTGAAPG